MPCANTVELSGGYLCCSTLGGLLLCIYEGLFVTGIGVPCTMDNQDLLISDLPATTTFSHFKLSLA